MPRLSSVTVARLALFVLIGGCALWLGRLDYGRKISTNVLDLIPVAERSPEAALVREFADSAQSRVMLFAIDDPTTDRATRQDAATRFANALKASGEFTEALVLGGEAEDDTLGRAIFAQRFALLLPGWLSQRENAFAATGEDPATYSTWLADTAADDLENYLSRPEASALQAVVVQDPLLTLPRLIEHAQLSRPAGNGDHALIWALVRESPLAEAGQQPVFDVIESARAELIATLPQANLRWSGINRFAAASRARIESEIKMLHVASIGAVLLVCALFVRRLTGIIHFAPVIVLSIAGAWTASTLLFDHLHIFVFVIGSLLAGVAVDYGVYIYLQAPLSPGEPFGHKLRRLLKPLLASCLTTVAGFSFLLFSDLPLIRQIGLFVGSGLLCALAVAMLYFAQLKNPFLPSRQFGGVGHGGDHPHWRQAVRGLGIVAALVALIGPWRLHWRDDVRELDIPSPALKTNEAELRALFGDDGDRTTAYLSYGANVAEARAELEAFLQHLQTVAPDVPAASLGLLLPTAADWQALPARLAQLGSFETDFRAALEEHGFDASAFDAFFNAWREVRAQPPTGDYASLVAQVDEMLAGPLALLSSTQGPYWFLTQVESADDLPTPPGGKTISVNQLQGLNELFSRYRWSALRLSLVGLGCIIGAVFIAYPPRRATRIALIPAGACFIVFGAFGLTGQTLNLFNLLGAFLGFCLSHNYAIFSSDNAATGNAPPVAIRLSALSTAAAFGVLGFSQIPVIHSLGLTVALIVVTALAMVELEPLGRRLPR